MSTTVHFSADLAATTQQSTLLVLGRRELLHLDLLGDHRPDFVDDDVFATMVGSSRTGDAGRTASSFGGKPVRKLVVGVLPDPCSRHNAPSRAWAIPGLVRSAGTPKQLGIVAVLEQPEYALATAMAIAQALPSFHRGSTTSETVVRVTLVQADGSVVPAEVCQVASDAVRRAAALVDEPPDTLHPARFAQVARQVAAELDGVSVHVLTGEQLKEQGLGGLYGVGQGAAVPPALVVLDYSPSDATERIAWVGKGITYDTGGLSIKSKTGMPGMKTDMGGAAAVLAGFEAAVRLALPVRLTAILCLAENAVGPNSIRPDDVLHMYSGKTVEINNTDAEGRLVLADGVAWAARHREPSILVDLATLTGAQGVATGRLHAAVMSNDEALEQRAVLAGRSSGHLAHPVPYAPELFRREFSSSIADMKNSVKDRSNAQVSCAGQFIGNHLGAYEGAWLHVDMASPAVSGGRGTGFGPGLLLLLVDPTLATAVGPR